MYDARTRWPRLTRTIARYMAGPVLMEDDLADASEIRSVDVKGGEGTPEMIVSSIRWYAADVASETVHPVVSLLIPKGATPYKRRSLYPSRNQFRITTSKGLLEKLWPSLEKASVKTTTRQRKDILYLLARGGRVHVPNTKWPTVIFLDSAGRPHIASRTPRPDAARSQVAQP